MTDNKAVIKRCVGCGYRSMMLHEFIDVRTCKYCESELEVIAKETGSDNDKRNKEENSRFLFLDNNITNKTLNNT